MKVQKCYIAGKISNLPLGEVDAKFDRGVVEVYKLGFEPVNPRKLPHQHDQTWCSYMREDLTALLSCDALYALSDWKESQGATIEVKLAESLGIRVIFESGTK